MGVRASVINILGLENRSVLRSIETLHLSKMANKSECCSGPPGLHMESLPEKETSKSNLEGSSNIKPMEKETSKSNLEGSSNIKPRRRKLRNQTWRGAPISNPGEENFEIKPGGELQYQTPEKETSKSNLEGSSNIKPRRRKLRNKTWRGAPISNPGEGNFEIKPGGELQYQTPEIETSK